MKQNFKTLLLGIAAVAVVVVAWGDAFRARRQLDVGDASDVRGQLLYKDFKDPLSVKSLDITTYDESTGTPQVFQAAVAGKSKLWSIPSHFNYPADAKDQVADAAAGLVDLKILGVADDNVQAHGLYGVLDPQAKDLKPGATGVGMHVTMKDGGGKTLLDLIIGKPVPGRTELRYVRKSGESGVYEVAAKTDRLSTKFEDWVEKSLLKFNSWDLKQIEIHDHSVDDARGVLVLKGEITAVNNDPSEPKWLIAQNKVFDGKSQKSVDRKLAPDEEANATKLDEIKTAFDELKIVDVEPKPKGLSADLKATEDFKKSREAMESLQGRGFFIVPMEGKYEIFSNQGETRCVMKSGVQYVMRFGDIALGTGGGASAKKDEKKGEKKPSGGSNRYIFVSAEFRPDVLPKPELEKLPDLPKEEPKKEEAKKDGAKKDDKKADAKKDEKKAEAKPAEKKPEEIKAERERIEKENKRKQDEYDEKVKAGQKEVKEANERFADWYYVISDDVFRKIHVNREDLIRKKEKKDEKKDEKKADDHAGHDHGPLDFDKLKQMMPGKK